MQMTQQNQTTILCDLALLPSLRSGLLGCLGQKILLVDIVLGSGIHGVTGTSASRQARVQPGSRAVSALMVNMTIRTDVAVYFRTMRGLDSRLSFGRESMSREGGRWQGLSGSGRPGILFVSVGHRLP